MVQPRPSLPFGDQSEGTESSLYSITSPLNEVQSTPRSVVSEMEGSAGSLHPVQCTAASVGEVQSTPRSVVSETEGSAGFLHPVQCTAAPSSVGEVQSTPRSVVSEMEGSAGSLHPVQCTAAPSSVGEVQSTPRSVVSEMEGSAGSLHPVQCTAAPSSVGMAGPVSQLQDTTGLVNQVLRKGTKRGKSSPYPSPNKLCKSPIPKIHRRARSGVENACTDVGPATQLANNNTPTRSAAISAWRHLDTSLFEMSTNEIQALDDLQDALCMHQLQKQVFSHDEQRDKSVVLLDLHEFTILQQSPHAEKSKVVYLQVLDVIADRKDTVVIFLNDIYARFIEGQGMKHLLVAGDAKVYDVLQSLKFEYGVEYSWLIPMLGDWHLLKNYQIALMKPYFEAGLKELAQVSGYPVAAIQNMWTV